MTRVRGKQDWNLDEASASGKIGVNVGDGGHLRYRHLHHARRRGRGRCGHASRRHSHSSKLYRSSLNFACNRQGYLESMTSRFFHSIFMAALIDVFIVSYKFAELHTVFCASVRSLLLWTFLTILQVYLFLMCLSNFFDFSCEVRERDFIQIFTWSYGKTFCSLNIRGHMQNLC